MELSEEEKKRILTWRKMNDLALKRKEDRLHRLKTAAEFEQWMQNNRVGGAYSAFCDDFGYQAREGEDRSLLYRWVLSIISAARNIPQREWMEVP